MSWQRPRVRRVGAVQVDCLRRRAGRRHRITPPLGEDYREGPSGKLGDKLIDGEMACSLKFASEAWLGCICSFLRPN